MNEDFYTFSEYMKRDTTVLTPSMEDYLEMIYRLSANTGFTRINELADTLNVQPPSVTRMIQKLAELNIVNYEKYGVIILKELGKQKGSVLLERHNIVEEFLKSIGVSNSLFEETEKIEHTVNKETLGCIKNYLSFLKENPSIVEKLESYIKKSD